MIRVTSQAGESYDVMREGDTWDCSCPQFAFRCRGIHGQNCKHILAVRDAGLLPEPSDLLAQHNLMPIRGGSPENEGASEMIVFRQVETPEDRVDALDEDTVRKVLVRLVKTVEHHGAPMVLLSVLNDWSLLSDRVADIPDGVAPSIVNAMGHLITPDAAKTRERLDDAVIEKARAEAEWCKPQEPARKAVSTEKYRDLISSLWRAFTSLKSCHQHDNIGREARWVRNTLVELTEADCPRAKDRDKDRARSIIEQATAYLESHGL